MKRLVVILSICYSILIPVYAQQDSIILKDLEIPNSPGFILLDKTPTSIERPTSSKVFILSVLNSLSDNNGLPQNYAIEFSPFWFFKHPNMTSMKYMGYDTGKNRQLIFNNIVKASFSAAYITTNEPDTKNPVSNLSIGARTNLISIRSEKDINDLRTANSKLIEKIKDQQDRLVMYVGDLTLSATNPTLYDKKVREFYAEEEIGNRVEKNEISEILKRRAVFALDGALACNFFFPQNSFSDWRFGRFGAWLTLNYSQPLDKNKEGKSYLNVYALGRYLSDGTVMENNQYTTRNYLDLGGKMELEFKNISFGYEYIYRFNEVEKTFRSNGIFKYKISDRLYVTGAFGKNFGSPAA